MIGVPKKIDGNFGSQLWRYHCGLNHQTSRGKPWISSAFELDTKHPEMEKKRHTLKISPEIGNYTIWL
jgi:hypothetical protein